MRRPNRQETDPLRQQLPHAVQAGLDPQGLQTGFALIEVLVSVAIAMLIMTVVINGFGSAWHQNQIVNEKIGAVILGHALLADARTMQIKEDRSLTGKSNGYQWRMSVHRVDLPHRPSTTQMDAIPPQNPDSGDADHANKPLDLFDVMVELVTPSGRQTILKALLRNQTNKPFALGGREAGATMIEILAALTITALLVSFFVPFASQILRHWTTGLTQMEANDQIMQASLHMQEEMAQAVPVLIRPSSEQAKPLLAFSGQRDFVRFVVPAADKATSLLQIVSFTIDQKNGQNVLVRRMSPFSPDLLNTDPRYLGNPIAIMAGQERMYFTFFAKNGDKEKDWMMRRNMPARITLDLESPDNKNQLPAPITLVTVAQEAHP